ncbi:hypothetical protein [Paraburkholderia tropica]|uniref:hypothetical protein n=1 Tax=Paraburkholderia tropica TaxID=92647 RepID=UPI002AB1298E|nr:hypothetical protein [Paraburkholderia tropica]
MTIPFAKKCAHEAVCLDGYSGLEGADLAPSRDRRFTFATRYQMDGQAHKPVQKRASIATAYRVR